MREHRRAKWTPLRLEHDYLREHTGIVLMQVQRRVRASQQVRMRRRRRVQQRGTTVSRTRRLCQLAGQLQLQVRGRLRRRWLYLQT